MSQSKDMKMIKDKQNIFNLNQYYDVIIQYVLEFKY
jgi:hypothetical protein